MFFVFIFLHFSNENKLPYFVGLLEMLLQLCDGESESSARIKQDREEAARFKDRTEGPLYRMQRRRREKQKWGTTAGQGRLGADTVDKAEDK